MTLDQLTNCGQLAEPTAKMTEMQPIRAYNNNGLEYLNFLWAVIKALYMVFIYMHTP